MAKMYSTGQDRVSLQEILPPHIITKEFKENTKGNLMRTLESKYPIVGRWREKSKLEALQFSEKSRHFLAARFTHEQSFKLSGVLNSSFQMSFGKKPLNVTAKCKFIPGHWVLNICLLVCFKEEGVFLEVGSQ